MKVTVLVSTMHQKDYSIVERMNIQSDAIIINQCEKNNIVEFQKNEYNIKFLSLNIFFTLSPTLYINSYITISTINFRITLFTITISIIYY